MLSTWLETNKTTKWSEGLRFIQFMKNKAHHSEINRSPYETMFGCKAKVGLKTFLPTIDALSEITSEEDLESILEGQSGNRLEPQNIILARDVDADTEHSADENTDHTFQDLQFVTHSVTIESEALNDQNTTRQINEESIVKEENNDINKESASSLTEISQKIQRLDILLDSHLKSKPKKC